MQLDLPEDRRSRRRTRHCAAILVVRPGAATVRTSVDETVLMLGRRWLWWQPELAHTDRRTSEQGDDRGRVFSRGIAPEGATCRLLSHNSGPLPETPGGDDDTQAHTIPS